MMKIRTFKALTFDCYGTLIDWEAGLLQVLGPWAETSGIAVSQDEILSLFARFESRREQEVPSRPYSEVLRLVFADLAAELEVPLSDSQARQLPRSVGDWPPFPDTVEALNELRRRYSLVVISNVDRALFAQTQERLGVAFDAVVTAEDVGCYKPDLAMFRRGLEVLAGKGIGKQEVLHVAQSLYHDHVPAKALGLSTAWIDRRRGKAGSGATPPAQGSVEPDLKVTSLAEFVELVEREGP